MTAASRRCCGDVSPPLSRSSASRWSSPSAVDERRQLVIARRPQRPVEQSERLQAGLHLVHAPRRYRRHLRPELACRHGDSHARRCQQGVRERLPRHPRPQPGHRGERVPRARRAVRLWQVDGAADGRRAGVDHQRRDEDRRPGRQRRRAEGPGHRHGVPELRPVPAHDGVRQHRLRPQAGPGAEGRRSTAGYARRRRSSSSSRTSTASRASCPAASASGWRWAGRSCASRPRFLMDEPLSNLDAKLRVQMRAEIARLQRDLGVTTIYVTHDQVEAMTMGDRVAVLKDGYLQQVDTPQNLYDSPVNVFVAAFIGSPSMNLYDAIDARRRGRGVGRRSARSRSSCPRRCCRSGRHCARTTASGSCWASARRTSRMPQSSATRPTTGASRPT